MIIRCYLRASTNKQNAGRAKNTLKQFVHGKKQRITTFYTENISGSTLSRPELLRLIDESHKGDILLIESVDRLTRLSQGDWEELKKEIANKDIRVVSLDLPTSHIVFNSSYDDEFMNSMIKAINSMLLDILAASAYKDNNERKRKQKEGIEIAKTKGKYKGRKPNKESHDYIKKLSENKTLSLNDIAKLTNTSRSTVIRVKKSIVNLSR